MPRLKTLDELRACTPEIVCPSCEKTAPKFPDCLCPHCGAFHEPLREMLDFLKEKENKVLPGR